MKLIAILTHNAEAALRQLKHEGSLKSFSPGRGVGVFTSDREFKIVNAPEQLMGLELGDYRLIGHPSEELIELARAMLR